MRIAIDARAFSWTGIGRYIRDLLAAIAKTDTKHSFTVLLGENDVPAFQELIKNSIPQMESALVDTTYYSWREQIVLRRQLNAIEADLWHFTHFNIPLFFNRPYVVTIHDVTRFIFPGQQHASLFQQLAYEQVFARAVAGSRGVICVSEHTRQELTSLPLKLPKNVAVIYEGITPDFFTVATILQRQKVRLLIGTSDPFILFVGIWMSHKNLPRLLEAFAMLLPQHPTLKLVLTGKPKPGYVDLLRTVRALKLSQHVIFAGFVPQPLLPALYAEASCFAFPSLYEGFGLPPLEALATGTPVVAARASSLPEVLGEYALYVNPESVTDIAAGLKKGLQIEHALAPAVATQLATQFNWEASARQHLNMYEDCGAKQE